MVNHPRNLNLLLGSLLNSHQKKSLSTVSLHTHKNIFKRWQTPFEHVISLYILNKKNKVAKHAAQFYLFYRQIDEKIDAQMCSPK